MKVNEEHNKIPELKAERKRKIVVPITETRLVKDRKKSKHHE